MPLGGSDCHGLAADAPLASPTTWVAAETAEPAAVLAGVRAGRTAITARRDGPVLLRVDGELIAIDADGSVLRSPDGRRRVVRGDAVRFTADAGPHLLETDDRAVLALAN